MLAVSVRLLVVLAVVIGLGTEARAGKSIALVIGNSAYQHAASLRSAAADADAVAQLFERLGFEVVKGADLTHDEFAKAIRRFSLKLRGADVAAFFYAGHAVQVADRNYLAPIDARLEDDADLDFEMVRMSTVMDLMGRRSKTKFVFLDACRDNELRQRLARSMDGRLETLAPGLARMQISVGTLTAIATQPDNVVPVGGDVSSPFSKALVAQLETPGVDVALLMRRVRQQVIQETEGAQVPWSLSSLTAPFVLKAKPGSTITTVDRKPAEQRSAIELAFWHAAGRSGTEQAYLLYLDHFPNGTYATMAKVKLGELRHRTTAKLKVPKAETSAAELALKKMMRLGTNEELKEKPEPVRDKQKPSGSTPHADRKAGVSERVAALIPREVPGFTGSTAELSPATRSETVDLTDMPAGTTKRPGRGPGPTKRASERPEEQVPEALSGRALTLALQTELKRIGCDPGRLDGVWGAKGRSALTRFNRLTGRQLPTKQATTEAVDAIKKERSQVCGVAGVR